MKRLRPIMFAGTGSDVGKSVIAAAFCRIFLQDGYSPAPFKAQNMALNSYATPEGLEIGRAQAVQAEAAGIACSTDMNPLLLKPTTDKVCQVVLNGKVFGNQSAREYFREEGRDYLRKEVCNAFDRLNLLYNPIVMEGAGSISEINLKKVDIVNMPMAIHARADVILVADIDKGGIFASVYGTIMLLNEEERKCVKGILVNKFRGDIKLFESAIEIIENLCKIPVIGVVPYFSDIYIEEEDSVMLHTKNIKSGKGKVNIAVILLPHLSNFTDFNILERDARVHLFYSYNPDEIEKADIIIIPGSKSTIVDLMEIRKNGIAQSILKAADSGKSVIGICGGYQMMGQDIFDEHHVESQIESIPGLGLLPVLTTLASEKITRQTSFKYSSSIKECFGYEIHMGRTTPLVGNANLPVNTLADGKMDGYRLNDKCFGSYIHGIFDNDVVIDSILKPYLMDDDTSHQFNMVEFKNEQYDKLANHVRKHVNMDLIYNMLIE